MHSVLSSSWLQSALFRQVLGTLGDQYLCFLVYIPMSDINILELFFRGVKTA